MCVLVTGCASVGSPLQSLREVLGPNAPRADAAKPQAGSAVAAAPAAAASGAAKPAADDAPVAPAVQRAYDDARRALAAGRNDEAERGLLALTASHPELGGPWANLGLLQRRTHRPAEAVASLEQAVKANPQQPMYWNQLGIAYREHGRFDQAAAAYDRAIALDAGYAAPLLNLAILNDLYRDDRAQALALYDRYLAVAPGSDATVAKWVADLKNRKPVATTAKKEQS